MDNVIMLDHIFKFKRSRNSRESKYLAEMINRVFILTGNPSNIEYAEMYASKILLELNSNENVNLSFLRDNKKRFVDEVINGHGVFGYPTVYNLSHALFPLPF